MHFRRGLDIKRSVEGVLIVRGNYHRKIRPEQLESRMSLSARLKEITPFPNKARTAFLERLRIMHGISLSDANVRVPQCLAWADANDITWATLLWKSVKKTPESLGQLRQIRAIRLSFRSDSHGGRETGQHLVFYGSTIVAAYDKLLRRKLDAPESENKSDPV